MQSYIRTACDFLVVLLLNVAYLSIAKFLWPNVSPLVFIPTILMALLTQRCLARAYMTHQEKRARAIMRTLPYYAKRAGLQAFCQSVTADTGRYFASVKNGDVVVDITAIRCSHCGRGWQIDINHKQFYGTDPASNETTYRNTTTSYVLHAATPVVDHMTLVWYNGVSQFLQSIKILESRQQAQFDSLDETHHAFIRKALVETGCVYAAEPL